MKSYLLSIIYLLSKLSNYYDILNLVWLNRVKSYKNKNNIKYHMMNYFKAGYNVKLIKIIENFKLLTVV